MTMMPFVRVMPSCPKCRAQMKMQGYCRGRDPRWDNQEMSWHLHGAQLQPGCDTQGEHLHIKCTVCGHSALMETADATKNAVGDLIDSIQKEQE